jgi:modification methylase
VAVDAGRTQLDASAETVGIEGFANRVICGDSAQTLRHLPDASVHLIITSPPYWNLVDYGVDGQLGHTSYEQYLRDMLQVWRECFRILIPNGKLCINTPIVPVSKKQMNHTHTRHLKNINNDIEASLLTDDQSHFERYSLFIWQKQTSIKMFGSYPYPPNLYEDNTIEFINVLVKPGKPRKVPPEVKEASRLTQEEWLNLTMQIWPMYPEDVSRSGGHPAPFPLVLPERLIRMYTFGALPEAYFSGDIVLDPFNGTGATCVAAKACRRRYIGIDLSDEFCQIARHRLDPADVPRPDIMLKRPKMTSLKPRSDEPVLFGAVN